MEGKMRTQKPSKQNSTSEMRISIKGVLFYEKKKVNKFF